MSSDPVIVKHAAGAYPVHIRPGALQSLGTFVAQYLQGRRVAMIVDETVLQLYHSGRLGQADWSGEMLSFPPGEHSKSRESWTRLTDELLDRGFGRDSGLVALGGGVTGDLAGFVAATYMRGIPYLQVPTTTVAMLDASVGGKTGVDTNRGKNLVGAFHPPVAVVADPATLSTLPEAEYRSGLAEAVKHGLIADVSYFEWITSHASELTQRNPGTLTSLIRRSVEIKAEVVGSDEREAGRRAILNAGHTVAHALELASDYQLLHGDAVAIGLVVECAIAEALSLADSGLSQRLASLLTTLGLPTQVPRGLTPTSILASMERDKKNRGFGIHFSLPADLGRMPYTERWTTAVPEALILAALDTSASP
jgi:3-dehydroquinate synthase